ncbi:ABC transporter ATP-binding protein/permease [Turicibacter sp. 1E2]|uniref:ABC transporter ATP-binding protein n=1 Tax=Turicibacter sp. 1E2 TaxID=2951143 RepID=UPI0021D4AC8C|nr:ABC transporter ATP-binding protein [Turicibacter sp. 1E2]MCU7208350.1 ABC transporter ATP-binding protein/permease [Turicibacter sp. 1E2]
MGNLERRIFTKHWVFNTLTIFSIFVYMGLHTWIHLEIIYLFDAVLEGNYSQFMKKVLIFLGLIILFCLIQFISQTMRAKAVEKMNRVLRFHIHKNLSCLSSQRFYKEEVGTYISWLTNDIKQIEESSFKKIFELFSYMATAIFNCIALYSIHYGLLLTAIISALILCVSPLIFKKKMQQNALNLSESQEQFTAQIKDIMCGFGVMKNYNLMPLFFDKLQRSGHFVEHEKFKCTYKNQKYLVVLMFINFLTQMACVIVGAALALFNLISAAVIMSLGTFAGSFCNAVSGFVTTLMSLGAGRAVIAKFDVEEEPLTGCPLEQFEDAIKLENLAYDYDGTEIFSDVNLSFEKGKKYAIVGPSGCGKSTILKIIMRDLEDFSGNVTIDGKDIKAYHPNSIYDHVAYISQETYLFDATIKDNITLFKGDCDEARLANVLEDSALGHEEIILERMNETVGEGGKNLSGGQRQRIAIARALFNQKSVIIMDEGTSALDVENAKLIEEKLLTNKNLTVILVTHHMNDDLKDLFDEVYEMGATA